MSKDLTTEQRLNATGEDLDPSKVFVVGIAVFRANSELDADSTPEILIVQRAAHESMANLWETPGGGVEASETMREAAFRELREETGLIATEIIGECPSKTWVSRRTGKVAVKHTFVAKVQEPLKVVLDPKEHQNWRWLKESEVETFNFENAGGYAVTEQKETMEGAFQWYKNNVEKF